MKKNIGLILLYVVVAIVTAFVKPSFLGSYNMENLIRWSSLFGIIGIGVSFVIITGGIDLSIGSVIGLVASLFPMFLVSYGWSLWAAFLVIFLISLGIGLFHGLAVTQLKLQPFVVTLCGLLAYRGISRYITGDSNQGFTAEHEGLREIAMGKLPITESFGLPYPFLIMVTLGVAAALFLNKTVYGRYLLALGRNEQAAKFSGINTTRMIMLSYLICSLVAGFGGVMFALFLQTVQPAQFGNFYELYAIAAAVLGGCSLRGGEGSIFGVILGAAILRLLYNSINLLGIPTTMEFAIIGVVIFIGVTADELVKRVAAKRRADKDAKLTDLLPKELLEGDHVGS